MSPIPRHVSWANREPHHKGHFGYDYSTASNQWYDPDSDTWMTGSIVIPSAGFQNVDIPAGNVSLIYRIKASSNLSEDFHISFFERGARLSDDFIVNVTSLMTEENGYLIFQGQKLIVSIDKDNLQFIHLKVAGDVGDSISIEMNLVRLP